MLKMMTLIDEYTRKCLRIRVARQLTSTDVLSVLSETIDEEGVPSYIRSDNGSEFIAHQVQRWLREKNIKAIYIDPGSPWQNGYVESFHDKFRRECLGREIFYTLSESRVVIADWRRKFNEVRPHRSLGMRTPKEFASAQSKPSKAKAGKAA